MTVQTMAVRRRQRPSGTGRNRPFTNLKPATQSFMPPHRGPWGRDASLAVKPNQPEDDGKYGVPEVALPNAALPLA